MANQKGPTTQLNLLILPHIFIFRIYILPNLVKLWGTIRAKIAVKQPYYIGIKDYKLMFLEVLTEDQFHQKMSKENPKKDLKNVDEMLYKEELP